MPEGTWPCGENLRQKERYAQQTILLICLLPYKLRNCEQVVNSLHDQDMQGSQVFDSTELKVT